MSRARKPALFIPYPPLPDHKRVPRSHFEDIIARKREFRPWTRAQNTADTDADTCTANRERLNLSAAQSLLAAYLSPITPYRSMMIYHGTGVGKTCTAVRIAETLMSPKPALVISPLSTRGGFRSTILSDSPLLGDMGHVDLAGTARRSCTGGTYLRGAPEQASRAEVLAFGLPAVRKRYIFSGYEQFFNLVQLQIELVRESFPNASEQEKDAEIASRLQTYSDRVIIVDEAHNLRGASKQKDVLGSLRLVLKHAKGVTLVLMSATPMYNAPDEIMDLLNLMLLNDGVSELEPKTVFNADGELLPEGAEALHNALRGRVSHVRGETPDVFPTRISAHEAGQTPAPAVSPKTPAESPALDLLGARIPKNQRLKAGLVYTTEMSAQQQAAYDAIESGSNAVVSKTVMLQQISNIVFAADHEKASGEAGFAQRFRRKSSTSSANMVLDYRSGTDRLRGAGLLRASPKIAEIVRLLTSCNGGSLVYSRFKWAGVAAVAVALEEAGWAPFKGRPLLSSSNPGAAAPRYALVTSDDSLGGGATPQEIVSAFNTGSSGIRAVLGTSRIAEGLDFRGLREVHVMEPWYNASVTEQVVGRAVRLCSHAHLPLTERNVTVYLHASCRRATRKVPQDTRETVDQKLHRMSFQKMFRIGKVAALVKGAALDCGTEPRNRVVLPGSSRMRLLTAQGVVATIPAGDRDGTAACNYSSCADAESACPTPAAARGPPDESTMSPFFVQHEVDMACYDATRTLTACNALTFTDLLDIVGCEPLILALALQTLLNPLAGDQWLQGRLLIYRAEMYILLSNEMVRERTHKGVLTLADARAGTLTQPLVAVPL